MTRAKHRPPHPLVLAYSAHRRHVIDLLLVVALALPVAAVYAAATDVAPDGTRAASSPTAVELPREPTGHGGPIGPLAGPTFAPDVPVWTEDKGPVVVDGQPLPAPAPVTTAPVEEAPTPDPEPAPAVAAADQPATGLLALVNADRAEAGCGPVTIADDLTEQAQTHSNAQAAADSMFHSSGIRGYDSWGENVAVGYDDEAAVHQAWMESPGHRKNIETCSFEFIGWASADGASGRYWTESFAA